MHKSEHQEVNWEQTCNIGVISVSGRVRIEHFQLLVSSYTLMYIHHDSRVEF